MSKIELYIDGSLVYSMGATPIPTPIPEPIPIPEPTPEPEPIPTPGPISTGTVLAWGLNPLNEGARINLQWGHTYVWIARVTEKVKGFEVIFTPQSDVRVDCNFKMPLKPDGKPYQTTMGKTEFNLWASYDGAIHTRVWSQALKGLVLAPCIYPGDFIYTLTVNRDGWGSLVTSLTP